VSRPCGDLTTSFEIDKRRRRNLRKKSAHSFGVLTHILHSAGTTISNRFFHPLLLSLPPSLSLCAFPSTSKLLSHYHGHFMVIVPVSTYMLVEQRQQLARNSRVSGNSLAENGSRSYIGKGRKEMTGRWNSVHHRCIST